jgi:hypothetical protein
MRALTEMFSAQIQTGAIANVPVPCAGFGNMNPYIGGFIIGAMVSYQIVGMSVIPNRIAVGIGNASGTVTIFDALGPAINAVSHWLTFANNYPGGIPITSATPTLWVNSVNADSVWFRVTLAIWLP